MNERRKEFAALIKATLHYLQDEWSEHIHIALKEPPPSRAKPPEAEKPAPQSPPVLKPVEKKKKEEPPLANWILNPMPLPEERPLQFNGVFQTMPLTVPVRLIAADPGQIIFLENVARALTKWIAPAALYSGKLDPLLTNHSVQLVLAPLSLLKKRFPQVELHQLLKIDGPALLPLADHYDLQLKRTLWNTLKSFQNTLPSSWM